MPRRVALPSHLLGTAFPLGDPIAAEVTLGRLRSADIDRPFRGVRSVGLDLSSTLARCHAYAPLLREGQFFCFTTAALLYAIPLPRALEAGPFTSPRAQAVRAPEPRVSWGTGCPRQLQ